MCALRAVSLRRSVLAVVVVVVSAIGVLGIAASSAQAHGAFYTKANAANDPAGGAIWFEGSVNASAPHPMTLYVYAQRRACGFWGCSWRTIGERRVSGTTTSHSSGFHGGEKGCHDYRTKTTAAIREPWNWEYFNAYSPTTHVCF